MDGLIEGLEKLVAINSVSGNEGKIVDFLEKNVPKYVIVKRVENSLFLHPEGLDTENKILVMNAHVDTVKPGKGWDTDPFMPVIKGGKLFGLGSSDCKASVAILLHLLKKGFFKDKNVIVGFVEKEEVDGYGTKLLLEYLKENFDEKLLLAWVFEPSDCLKIGGRGNVFLKVKIHGKGGHAAKKEALGLVNPIEETFKLLSGLREITSANLTMMEAGSSINTIPDHALAGFDVRTSPESHEGSVKELKKFLKKRFVEVLEFSESPGWLMDEEHEFVKKFKEIIGKVGVSLSSSDACFFFREGIPVVEYGPGNPEAVHGPNEFIEVKKLLGFEPLLKKLVCSLFTDNQRSP